MMEISMTANIGETAKDVVRRNTEEVQGRGNWALFKELFADDFVDHTPQPGGTRDKAGVLALYKRAFPDFTPEIHWQRVDGDVVTSRHASRQLSRNRWHRHQGQLRDRRRNAGRQRQDHGALGRGKPLLGHAAVGRDHSTAAALKR
jgi:SnoaL-like domain